MDGLEYPEASWASRNVNGIRLCGMRSSLLLDALSNNIRLLGWIRK